MLKYLFSFSQVKEQRSDEKDCQKLLSEQEKTQTSIW